MLDVADVRADRALLASTITAGIIRREMESAGVSFTLAAAQGAKSLSSLLDTWEASRAEQLVTRELPRLIAVLSPRGTHEAAA